MMITFATFAAMSYDQQMAWLRSDEHLHNCVAHGEGSECCLVGLMAGARDKHMLVGSYHDSHTIADLTALLGNTEELARLNKHRGTEWAQPELDAVIQAAIDMRKHGGANVMKDIHLTTVHGKCRHEPGECLTGPHGAALRLLKGEPVADDTLHIADIQLANIERVQVFEDRVHVLYWWGNSNVYRPYTKEQWDAALACVTQGMGVAQVVRTGPDPNYDASYIEAGVTRFYPNGCLTVGDLRKLLEGVDQDTWVVDSNGPIKGAIVVPAANEPFLSLLPLAQWNAYRARMAEKDRT